MLHFLLREERLESELKQAQSDFESLQNRMQWRIKVSLINMDKNYYIHME